MAVHPNREPATAAPDEQHGQPPSAAPHDRVGRLATRAIEDGERRRCRPRCPSRPARLTSRASSPSDPVRDSARRSVISRAARPCNPQWPGMAPAGDPCRVVERDIKPTKVDDQPQVLDVRLAIVPIRVVPPGGSRQPAGAFVEPDGIRRDADVAASSPIRIAQETLESFECQGSRAWSSRQGAGDDGCEAPEGGLLVDAQPLDPAASAGVRPGTPSGAGGGSIAHGSRSAVAATGPRPAPPGARRRGRRAASRRSPRASPAGR